MRINVIGTSGSGKSTFAKALAQKLAVPYVEMDALYWKPNWGESSDAELFAKLEQALARPAWVLDGNYKRTQPIKWRTVETIIWVDYSFARTLFQAVKRAVQRLRSGKEIWAGPGNRETFRKSFLSRDSIILWTLKTWRQNRRRYLADMQDPQYRHIRFVRVRNPRQAEALLRELEAQRSAGHI